MTAGAAHGPLRVVYFVHFAAFGVFLPFFPRWVEARGLTGAAAGLLYAVPPAIAIVAPPLAGALADALGLRAQLMRVASLLGALAFVGVGALAAVSASPVPASTAWGLAVLVALYALARALLFGMVDVIALEALGADHRRFGALRLWGSLGFLATAASFALAFDPGSAIALPGVVAALYLATLVASFALPARSVPLPGISRDQLRALRRDVPFFAAVGLWQIANAAYDTTYSLHVRDAGLADAHAGLLWASGVVSEVAVMAFGARLVGGASTRGLLLAGIGASVARWGLVSVASSAAAFGGLQLLHGVTFGVTWLAANARLPALAVEGRLATAQGVLAASVGVGSVAGSLLWATLYARAGGGAVFAGAALAAGAAALAATRVGR